METRTPVITTWDRIMMAITFAEVGEHETARELLTRKESAKRTDARVKNAEQRPEIRA
jgi:hypothetical protein